MLLEYKLGLPGIKIMKTKNNVLCDVKLDRHEETLTKFSHLLNLKLFTEYSRVQTKTHFCVSYNFLSPVLVVATVLLLLSKCKCWFCILRIKRSQDALHPGSQAAHFQTNADNTSAFQFAEFWPRGKERLYQKRMN